MKRPGLRTSFVLVASVTFLFLSFILLPSLMPQTGESASLLPELGVEERTALEQYYSPILQFTSGEMTYPVGIDYFLNNSRLVSPAGGNGSIIDHPSIGDLTSEYGPNSYLDEIDGTYESSEIIERYELDMQNLSYCLYVHTIQGEGKIAIQYWSFYVFDDGTFNRHEGDWEMVQVVLDRASLTPTEVMVSEHHSGSRLDWDSVEKGGQNSTHPVIFVAKGSHASYLSTHPNIDYGDVIDGLGKQLVPDEYDLISTCLGNNESTLLPWLYFGGTWGEQTGPMGSILGTNGPLGPMYREGGTMWNGLRWGASLQVYLDDGSSGTG